MMLTVCPARRSATTRREQRERDRERRRSAPSASRRRNSSTIRPVSSAPSAPSVTRPADRALARRPTGRTRGRCGRRRGPATRIFGSVALSAVDHVERRRVGALGDRHVDGAPAVHERDVVDDVGAVLDAGDVAQVDRRARARCAAECLSRSAGFCDHRVRRRDGREVADAHVARRAASGSRARASSRPRRATMPYERMPIGIDVDDDRADLAARRRRRRHARQRREQRTHRVEREILDLGVARVGRWRRRAARPESSRRRSAR